MYIGHSVAEFNIAADKTLVIGNTSNDGAIDSLAGTGVIVKEGAGELVLNADNNAFTWRDKYPEWRGDVGAQR